MAPALNPDCWLPEVLTDIVENPEDEQEGVKWPATPTGPEGAAPFSAGGLGARGGRPGGSADLMETVVVYEGG